MNNNPEKLRLARQWAERVTKLGRDGADQANAAAEVIESLPDTIVDGDKVKELIDNFKALNAQLGFGISDQARRNINKALMHDLEDLLAPKPRTLADMSPEEREACQWMQATFTKTHYQHVIASVAGNKTRLLRREDGSMFEVPHDEVIPLPDRPRMVWPDEHYPEDGGEEVPLDPTDAQDLADLAEDEYTSPRTVQDLVHLFEGRAESERAAGDAHVGDVWQRAADTVWTTLGGEAGPLPAPEDCKPGEAWLVNFNGRTATGMKNTGGIGPWTIQSPGDCEAFYAENDDVELLARLTPDRSVEK